MVMHQHLERQQEALYHRELQRSSNNVQDKYLRHFLNDMHICLLTLSLQDLLYVFSYVQQKIMGQASLANTSSFQ